MGGSAPTEEEARAEHAADRFYDRHGGRHAVEDGRTCPRCGDLLLWTARACPACGVKVVAT
jgi:hypothetical protein